MPHLPMVFVPSAKVCKPVVVNIQVCIWVIDHFGPGVRCLIQTTSAYFFLQHFYLLRNSSQPQNKITAYGSKLPQQMPPPSLPLTLPTEKAIFFRICNPIKTGQLTHPSVTLSVCSVPQGDWHAEAGGTTFAPCEMNQLNLEKCWHQH